MEIYKVGEECFDSKAAAARYLGMPKTTFWDRLKAGNGSFNSSKGVVRTMLLDEKIATVPMSPILKQISERYSVEEQKLLAKGINPQAEQIHFPEPCFVGKKFRFGAMSDLHIGSKYFSEDYLREAFRVMRDMNVDFITLGGDIVDGVSPKRQNAQIYELTEIGYKAQRDKAISLLSEAGIPIFAIAGNHDLYFIESAGANIVEDISQKVPNMTYLGAHEGNICCDGATIKLWHGLDGSSYATSYRIQKIIESLSGGEKPNILLVAHTHKFCYIFDRNIHAVSTGCMQKQTMYMRGKKLAAHIGFQIIEFEVNQGKVCNFVVRNYPFYA